MLSSAKQEGVPQCSQYYLLYSAFMTHFRVMRLHPGGDNSVFCQNLS